MLLDALVDRQFERKAEAVVEKEVWPKKTLPNVTVSRPDGSSQALQYKVTEVKDIKLHSYLNVDAVTYVIPSDGPLNILVSTFRENAPAIPLAAASMKIQADGTPLITQLQMCQAIEHPLRHLLKGPNKIAWSQILLEACQNLARQNECVKLQLQSGFYSKYLLSEYPLSLAIKQYDSLVKNQSDWVPMQLAADDLASPITGESFQQLKTVMRKVNEKKYRSKSDIQIAKALAYPDLILPNYWEMKL